MTNYRLFAIAFLFLFISWNAPAQSSAKLPRSVPEAEGVSSDNIIQFLDAAAKSKTEFHSFMLLRHGKVIAEGWWNPYRSDLRHTLYSCSKSFTATAVGFAVQEKKLSLSDKVISFFPNDVPDTVSKWLAELTVKDVLMMSDGQEPDPSFAVASKDTNWIKGFLSVPIVHEPGTQFLYNSLGTYMLSAIVQKVTGQKVVDWLKPRLFDPLGIQNMDWETDLKGINTGGWGLRVKTEDMAKFAELFLQKGNWNGKQIISPAWIEEASTMKIMQEPNAPQSKKDSSDWLQGYCYQMWRCRHDAYRGDGAYGQFMIVMPKQDAVIAITAETPDMQEEINLVWQYLLPAFKDKPLTADANAQERLKKKIQSLALPIPPKTTQALEKTIGNKIFVAEQNPLNIQHISFSFHGDACMMSIHINSTYHKIIFSSGKWKESETNFPMPSLTATGIEDKSMIYPAKVAASYSWKDDHTLQLILRYIESPHTETFTCTFDNNKLSMEVTRSFDFGKKYVTVQAEKK